MFKYILLDFDGTLVDTNDLIILTLRETSKRINNRDLSQEDLNTILSRSLQDQIRYITTDFHDQAVAYYKEFYKSNHDKMIMEYPGTRSMLRKLKDLGCKTAIVSSKGRGGIERGLNHFQLQHYIDAIVSAYDVENGKPHPEPAVKAVKLLGGDVENALMVGDSPYDILCGRNAGIKTVLVNWSIFPEQELSGLNSDFRINTPGDLIEIVISSQCEEIKA